MRRLALAAVLALAPTLARAADVEARVESLLSKMTLDEKISILSGVNGMDLRPIPRLGVPSLHMTDGPLGVRAESGDRATAFPAAVAAAATFDAPLVHDMAAAMADETLALGRDMLLGPCVNIARAPHGGRNFESFGEDPHLAALMSQSWVKGLQGRNVLASVKHYALNNQEFRRMFVDVRVGERAMREIFFPAFEAAVNAGAWTVMAAYNKVNGVYASENPYLLRRVLKEDWGFKGFVVSDWDATHGTVAPANAGLDVEMPGGVHFTGRLKQAVADGKVAPAVVDDMARRVLRAMIGGGVMDRKPEDRPSRSVVGGEKHRELALRLAREGTVLLKNDGFLPLKRTRTIAVIGPTAGELAAGAGSSAVRPSDPVSPFEGLRRLLGSSAELRYVQGASFPVAVPFEPVELAGGLKAEYWTNPNLEGAPAVTRVDSKVDFVYDQESPDPKIPRQNFSARWTGKLKAPASGEFTLAVKADDGVRLWVDGKQVVDAWIGEPPTLYAAKVKLEAGREHELRLEYFQGSLGAMIQLGWLRSAPGNFEAAVSAAKGADAVLMVVGTTGGLEGENVDRVSLDLPAGQEELVERVAAVNPNVVVALTGGSPFVGGRWLAKTRAALMTWFPGEQGGQALAEILLGRVNPSGRTPVTWPKRWEDSSAYGRYPGDGETVDYSEGIYVGYRWFDKKKLEPLFPFGHGLSYTRFAYANMTVSPTQVALDVTNAGEAAGAEVVQVYVSPKSPSVDRPERELKAFARVPLAPGETKRVTLPLDGRAFARYDEAAAAWKTDPGPYAVRAGASSRDIRLEKEVVLK